MRIPLTKYGLPQVVILPLAILIMMLIVWFAGRGTGMPLPAVATTEGILAVLLVWSLSFFRDPYRKVPDDKNVLLAPADGTITDIETVENEYIGGKALRIGIFLSIFNTHINRAPCEVEVKRISYKKGKYKNAMDPKSGRVNESNTLELLRVVDPKHKLIVRQISGAIARRIVCAARQGQRLAGGEKFGMLKFGSRTELYVPISEDTVCMVKKGDKVKAGLSPMIKFNNKQK